MEVDASSAACVCLVVDGAAASWRLAVVAKELEDREGHGLCGALFIAVWAASARDHLIALDPVRTHRPS